jgi:hypothetical protein
MLQLPVAAVAIGCLSPNLHAAGAAGGDRSVVWRACASEPTFWRPAAALLLVLLSEQHEMHAHARNSAITLSAAADAAADAAAAHLFVWARLFAACCWLHPAERVCGVLDGVHQLCSARIQHLTTQQQQQQQRWWQR